MQANDTDAQIRYDIDAALVFAATGIMPMKDPGLTPEDMRAWQVRMHFTFDTAAVALGLARSNYAQMVKGRGGSKIDFRTALACAALEAGLQPLKPQK
jgi:hypothetical protein